MIGIILFVYFVVVITLYFTMGGFYFSKTIKKEQLYAKKLNREFVSNKKNKVYKGVYAGVVDFSGAQHYLFQFSEILKGENRYVNIYYAINEDDEPTVIESNSKLQGDVAYLLLNPYGYYSGNNTGYDLIFSRSTLMNPKEFLDTIGVKLEDMPKSLFVTALTIMDADINVELMNWTKNEDSVYIAKKYAGNKYAFEIYDACKINTVQRKSSTDGLVTVLVGVVDVITAPIQALVILFYFLLVMFAGGPVK